MKQMYKWLCQQASVIIINNNNNKCDQKLLSHYKRELSVSVIKKKQVKLE